MAKRQTNWETPDWQDASAYPAKLTPPQWRWEFTRRRADYRKAWQQAKPIRGKWAGIRRRADGGWILDPRLRALEDQFNVKHSDQPGADVMDFELEVLLPIIAKRPKPWTFDLGAPVAPQLRAAARTLRALQRKGPKVRAARKAKAREHYIYPRYLRILDARAAGVRASVIARTLYPSKPAYQASANLARDEKRARELLDHFPHYG